MPRTLQVYCGYTIGFGGEKTNRNLIYYLIQFLTLAFSAWLHNVCIHETPLAP